MLESAGRAQIGETGWQGACATGKAMSQEAVIELALEPERSPVAD
jgi:hypothetical protein